jgi:hypothetical protein
MQRLLDRQTIPKRQALSGKIRTLVFVCQNHRRPLTYAPKRTPRQSSHVMELDRSGDIYEFDKT